jgi:tetratricopeptide (TPR) repeat protein
MIGLGVVLALVLWPAASPRAQDWTTLHQLTEAQLADKIAQLHKQLESEPTRYTTLQTLGIAYHLQAERDPKKALPRAVEFLSRAYALDARDSVTMVYLGSATTMLARTTDDPMRKMAYVTEGIALMDKAVRRDPDHLAVRLLRGLNAARLPAALHRSEVAIEDFEHVVGLMPQYPNLPLATWKIVYSNLAELYHKANNQTRAAHFRQLAEAL